MRRAPAAIAIAAAVAIVAVRASVSEDRGFPLVSIPQGLTGQRIGGERLFVIREGTLTLRAFVARDPGSGVRLWYCVREEVFFDPGHGSLYTAKGEWVIGPSPRDLDRARLVITPEQRLKLGRIVRARGRSKGSVRGEVGLAYDLYLHPRSDLPPPPTRFCERRIVP